MSHKESRSDEQTTVVRYYWPQLDGLRFLAAVLVLLAHSPSLPFRSIEHLQRFGWIGVDLFLVLSAFLLTRLLRLEYERNGTISFRKFYIRRALRIWPLYFGFISAMLVLAVIRNPDSVIEYLGFWWSHMTFSNNVVVSILGFERRLPFTSHLWTISLEEQFYMVIPLLIYALSRLAICGSKIVLATGVIIGLFLGIRLGCTLLQVPHPFVWVLPIRADSIVFGVALGLGFKDNGVLKGKGVLLFMLGCSVLVASSFMPSLEQAGWSQIIGYTVVDLGCLLLVMGILEKNFIATILSNRALCYLGKISFGIYVYHTLALAVAGRVASGYFGDSAWAVFTIALVLSIVTASLSYQLWERRFLLLKDRFAAVKSRPV